MIFSPINHFLGLDDDADAASLLGLQGNDAFDRVRIESALRMQLGRLLNHPDHNTEQAEVVRDALRRAADELIRASIHRKESGSTAEPGQSPSTLTPFDRMVLAVLVGHGGWNSRSRAQLVAVASAWGVTVQGLIRVIEGLAHYAQSGGGRLTVSDITSDRSLLMYMPPTPTGGLVGPPLLEKLTENFSAELKRDNPWTTIKLSAIFGVVTVAACIIGVRVVFFGGGDSKPENSKRAQEPQRSQVSRPIQRPPTSSRIATFPKPPSFLGLAVPPEAISAAASLPTIPTHLDDAVRKLSVEASPSDAVFRNWEESIKTVSSGWLLGDLSTRNQINQKVFEVLRAAGDRPTASDRLLLGLMPPANIGEPSAITRGAWQVGTLARLAHRDAATLVPPTVSERARASLQQIIGGMATEDPSFEVAANKWLDSLIPELVRRTETDQSIFDYWETWLAAQRGVGRGDQFERSVMDALHATLATNTDLGRAGPSVDVVARLLNTAIETKGEIVKQEVINLFDAEDISPRDLWIVTSLMATSDTSRWFPARLVLPEDADQRHRWRIRDELVSVWPPTVRHEANQKISSQGRSLVLDEQSLGKWQQAVDSLLAEPLGTTHETVIQQLLAASQLAEAAEALARQNPLRAQEIVSERGATNQASTHTNQSPRLVRGGAGTPGSGGRTSMIDGEWARNYQDAGRNVEQRLQLIYSLRSAAGNDLGPADADAFVREVYRGSPPEVRNAAQDMVVHFSAGPNVAMAMLDHFPDAVAADQLGRAIGGFTNQTLPGLRGSTSPSGGWAVAARRALLTHALQLQTDAHSAVDELSDQLLRSYLSRLAQHQRVSQASVHANSVHEAAGLLSQAMLREASTLMSSQPAPDSLAGLERRRLTRQRLADGPIQSLVAEQLTILDAITYILTAEQPAKRNAAMALQAKAASARANVTNALEQSLQVERAVLLLWRLRFLSAEATATDASGDSISASPAFPTTSAAAQGKVTPYIARLEALNPERPLDYFLLAEEVFDEAGQEPALRDLARHLFALAGVLGPDQLGRSACLALADMETNQRSKRKLRALASLLGSESMPITSGFERANRLGNDAEAAIAAAMGMGEAFSYYRRGQGNKAADALKKPGVTELMQQYDRLVPGGATRFAEELKVYRGTRPNINQENLIRMLRLELTLLGGQERSWSGELLLTGGASLIEVDPHQLQESLGVDASKPLFRSGRWVEM